jgi:hypothetical protein
MRRGQREAAQGPWLGGATDVDGALPAKANGQGKQTTLGLQMTEREVEERAKLEARRMKERFHEAMAARVRKLAADGLSATEITALTGKHRDFILRAIAGTGIQLRRQTPRELPAGAP